MKVDEKATKAARERHAAGLEKMNELFAVDPTLLGAAHDGRWLSKGKALRRLYRRHKARTNPDWEAGRARRKRQRRARKENR